MMMMMMMALALKAPVCGFYQRTFQSATHCVCSSVNVTRCTLEFEAAASRHRRGSPELGCVIRDQ